MPATATSRRAAAGTVVLVTALLGGLGGSSPALAHEFTLAVVTPTAESSGAGVDGREVRDGFRLAVDQSPDVSHPPGADAGDHLGGVDVDIRLVDGGDAAAAARAVEQQVADGLTAALVVAAERTSAAVAEEVEGTPTVLLVAQGAGAGAPPGVGDIRLRQRPGWTPDSAAAAEFTAAFERAHGRTPSPAAALGYDAGRLLSAAVGAADQGAEDPASVVAAAATSGAALVSSDVTAPATASAEPSEPASSSASAGAASKALPLLAAAAGGVLLVLLGGRRATRSRRHGP